MEVPWHNEEYRWHFSEQYSSYLTVARNALNRSEDVVPVLLSIAKDYKTWPYDTLKFQTPLGRVLASPIDNRVWGYSVFQRYMGEPTSNETIVEYPSPIFDRGLLNKGALSIRGFCKNDDRLVEKPNEDIYSLFQLFRDSQEALLLGFYTPEVWDD